VAKILSFISIFIACILCAMVIASIIAKFLKLPGLGLVNSFGGGVVGFFKGFLMVSLIIIFLLAILPQDSHLLQGSATLPFVLRGIKTIDGTVPKDIKDQYHNKLDNIKSKIFQQKEK